MIIQPEFIFCLSPLAISVELPPNKYAQSIPYESLYRIDERPNKNTMEYNTLTTEELVREQNIKILEKINKLEKQQEIHK